MAGVKIPRDAWCADALALHLKLRLEVVDGQQVVAEGRTVMELKARLKSQVAEGFQSLDTGGFERNGLTDWTFGPLPEAIEVAEGGLRLTGYPALVDRGDSVSLRLMDTPERARHQSRLGVRRLYMLRLKDQVKYLRRHLPDVREACLLHENIGGSDALKSDLIETAFAGVYPRCRLADRSSVL